ncbi:MAG: 3-phosphoserine/phosphohydroxythreonine transaminase [Acidobacteriota bacterium]
MMGNRIFNFNPGPATLPLPVLEKVRDEFIDYSSLGMSVTEISHRSKQFEAVMMDTKKLLAEIMGIPPNYKIIFLGGGASLQFAMIPMNFLPQGKNADYVITGEWAQKAHKEAKLIGKTNIAATTEADGFRRMPRQDELKLDPNACYVHITSNETISGTQWQRYPDVGNVPLIADMSSDILSRKVDVSKFGVIYAGAQKNLGPAGVTVVIIHDDLVAKCPENLPTMLNYKTHVSKDSLYNTPPVFAIYMVKLVLEWLKAQGGLKKIEEINNEKGRIIYGILDEYPDYYRSAAHKDSRSIMNVTLRLPNEDLEKKFIDEASKAGFHGLKGHRSVGGIRVSMYNAMPLEGIQKLAAFMEEFKKNN